MFYLPQFHYQYVSIIADTFDCIDFENIIVGFIGTPRFHDQSGSPGKWYIKFNSEEDFLKFQIASAFCIELELEHASYFLGRIKKMNFKNFSFLNVFEKEIEKEQLIKDILNLNLKTILQIVDRNAIRKNFIEYTPNSKDFGNKAFISDDLFHLEIVSEIGHLSAYGETVCAPDFTATGIFATGDLKKILSVIRKINIEIEDVFKIGLENALKRVFDFLNTEFGKFFQCEKYPKCDGRPVGKCIHYEIWKKFN